MPETDTTPAVTAEGSYDWWRTEVAARDADLEHLRHEFEEMTKLHDAKHQDWQRSEGELGRLRNRITALEANGSELLARAERAEAVVAALPDPSTAEELREKITELLGSPDEALLDAFLGYAWSETARIAGGEMTARWQAEDLLRVAHETSNRSEAERARAVQRAEQAEYDLEIRTHTARSNAKAHRVAYLESEKQREQAEAAEAELALHVGCRVDISIGDTLRLIRAPESTADAPSPVSAATEAHGETTEAQEGGE